MKQHHHPKSILYIGFLVLYVSVGLDKRIMICIHHYNITQSIFTVLKISVLHLFISARFLQSPLQPLIFPLSPSFAFFRMSYYWNDIVCSIFKLASFIQQNAFKIPLSFSGLIAHFFSALNSIPLYGCTTVSFGLP